MLTAALVTSSPAAAGYTSIVIDAESGVVLQNNHGDARNYPASLTKMMTLYLAFEALDEGRLTLDQELPVSAHAERQAPSKLGLRVGETIRVEHAILALVTKSANDVAVVLAEALGGSEAAFAVRMTEKARALGMGHTTFRNASGLPNDQQMSTPRDMAALGLALIQDWPKYYRYFSRASFSYQGSTHANHNHLMERYPGMDGIKTGFINKSGFNLAASAVRDGHRIVAVVFGGPSAKARDRHMATLLDAAFRRIATGGGHQNATPEPEAMADAGADGADTAAAGDEDEEEERPAVAKPARPVVQVAARSAPAPRAKAANHGRWMAQLGTYSTQQAGRSALNQASRRLPPGVGRPNVALHKAGTRHHPVWRAVLVGFEDERTARRVCSSIKIKGHTCTVAR